VGPRAVLDAVAMRINPYPTRELNPGRPACNLVTILTEQGRLLDVEFINSIPNFILTRDRKKFRNTCKLY